MTVLGCDGAVVALAAAHGYVAALEREGRKRQRLLDQLAATQADLTAAEREQPVSTR